MKKVDIIRPSSIYAINGPIGTLKRILYNREYFMSRGYEVELFTNESLQQGPFFEVPSKTIERAASPTLSWLRRFISRWLRSRARVDLWAAKLIDKKSKKEAELLVDYYLSLNRTPDIVQFHSDTECYLYLKKHKGTLPKIILFQHTDGIPLRMLTESLPGLKDSKYLDGLKSELDQIVERVDRLVFIARIGQTNCLKHYPQRTHDDTSVIINGIDKLSPSQSLEVAQIKEKGKKYKYRLCCTGTVSYRKGQRIIIMAISKLPEDLRKQISVDFIGDGAEKQMLENLSADLGMTDQVHFLGNKPNKDVYKYLAENNVYVLMSKNEGLPISIIEAMRVGLPIISTRVSGIPELVEDGYNGFLLNPDVDELADLLRRLPEFDLEKMGRNSMIRFENEFTFERMEREFCDMYDKTLRNTNYLK